MWEYSEVIIAGLRIGQKRRDARRWKQWHFSFPLPLQHGPGIQSSLNPHGWDETKPGRQKECSKNQRCQPLTPEDAAFFRFKIILLDTWPPLRESSAVVYDEQRALHSLTLLCEVQGGCLGEPGLAQGWAHSRWRWPTQRMGGQGARTRDLRKALASAVFPLPLTGKLDSLCSLLVSVFYYSKSYIHGFNGHSKICCTDSLNISISLPLDTLWRPPDWPWGSTRGNSISGSLSLSP